MIGLDTNILMRMVLKDDADALKKIVNLITKSDEAFYISIIVMIELIWNLEKGSKYSKAELIEVVKSFAKSQNFVVEYSNQILAALDTYESSKAGLADVLIAEVNKFHGCTKTLTFDKNAAKLDAFDLL